MPAVWVAVRWGITPLVVAEAILGAIAHRPIAQHWQKQQQTTNMRQIATLMATLTPMFPQWEELSVSPPGWKSLVVLTISMSVQFMHDPFQKVVF